MKKREIQKLEKQDYDLAMIARTQPQGNIRIRDRVIESGTGVEACLHVYRYPSSGLKYFWLIELTQFNNTITTLSLGTENKEAIKKALQRSTDEKLSQAMDKNGKTLGKLQADKDYRRQLGLLSRLGDNMEVMKRADVRIFVYADDEQELNKRIKAIKEKLGTYGVACFVGEQDSELRSLWTPMMKQELLPNVRHGTPIAADVLGKGFPFNHVKLDDDGGSYFGKSTTNGPIMLNPLLITPRRLTPYFMIAGNPRNGKSTFAKKLNDDVFARGGKLRIFDVKGEYIKAAREQGGTVITLDGSSVHINPFEIFPTATKEIDTPVTVTDEYGRQMKKNKHETVVDEIGSFNAHVQKLRNMFSFQNSEATTDDLNRLENIITDYYISEGLWVKHPGRHLGDLHSTGLPHNQYPKLGDFLTYLKEIQRSYLNPNRPHPEVEITSINRIVDTFQKMLQSEAIIFDGFTTIPDMTDTDVVVYDLSGLKAHGNEVFNSQVYSALSLVSAEIVNNGKRYRYLYNNHQIDLVDIPYYWVCIDEFQNYAKEEFSAGLEWLSSLMEEMAKDFCGISLIMPTIKELMPDQNYQATTSRSQRYFRSLSKVFGMMTYRCFFHLSDDDIPRLSRALGSSVTPDELGAITKLPQKKLLMNIQGDQNYVFTVHATPDELNRYQGGAG
ncbi:ATPase [Levilactobacillus brevis]|uniref:ATPase n=1 Tax=Levilactobacillus brevis TaxID=1580 RepID=UPI000BE9D49C|nr:ATPase [Levilactobacillus brevis]MCZ2119811.1 type IV secretory system conjugative DNA transfer family protein [Levilactobacillus brevis]MCZ2125299.1 type IV secretory system conjugative DNA transfer family protein [Levilactobacillus brevis]MCZ2209654.1 type IV secretory system conjugative DNA transfer family protein [Levilactobacillus brevis]MCZ2325075.1 type IV secretory system conjugative DNA transfer family protein [Levilactobacillus brevis]